MSKTPSNPNDTSDNTQYTIYPNSPEDYGTHVVLYGCNPVGTGDPPWVPQGPWYPGGDYVPIPLQPFVSPPIIVMMPIICEFCKHAFDNADKYNEHIDECKDKERVRR